MDVQAGRKIVEFLREDPAFREIPILIFTDEKTMMFTHCVKRHPLTGSTSQLKVVEKYIDILARGDDNQEWAQFDAKYV